MKLLTALGLAAMTAFVPAAQLLSGRWSAAPQPGMTVTFDLSVAGAVVTGTMTVTQQDSGSAIGSVEQGTMNGSTLSLRVRMGDQTAAFVGELNGEELRLRSADNAQAPALLLRREKASPAPPATAVTTPAGWRSTARSASLVKSGGRTVLNVAAAAGEGVVWQEQSALQDGTIDVELRGRDVVGQSFLGVAFRGLDDRTYEAVYFRPFNFATTDSDRRLHAVQYHSSPDHPWSKLRAEHPDQYEKPITPVPDPNDWFRVRIVLDGRALSVFVNDAQTPTLTVTTLAVPRPGMVGVWLGNGSGGEFANLKVTPAR
jgi:3-keto-disaccharide hydrolase